MKGFDYLIVGAGLFGAVFAKEAYRRGKKCLVIEKRGHIGGCAYTENIEGINVHKYGAHIFHTNDKDVWEYINCFANFNQYTHNLYANFNGEIFSLPFNMNTFYQMYGVTTPSDARKRIDQSKSFVGIPSNLEEQAISMVGDDIYEKLIKSYTEKQWGKKCSDLPASIIKRLPLRFSYNCSYYNDRFQGIPDGGYTEVINSILFPNEVMLNTNYFDNREYFDSIADTIVFTGLIDEFFNYRFGKLEYRSLRFETETLDCPNYQGVSVMNFTSNKESYTRIIEHKHFESFGDDIYKNPKTIITKEYPIEFSNGTDPYYPINDEKNTNLYNKYKEFASINAKNVIFGGRLGEYKYYDMDQVIKSALSYWHEEGK